MSSFSSEQPTLFIAPWKLLVFFLVLFAVVLAMLLAWANLTKTRSVREGFAWTDWNYNVKGRVGKDETVMGELAQEEVRREINRLNRSFDACVQSGVEFPQDWRPTEHQDTCALDMTNLLVRNRCSIDNPSFANNTVVNKVYIDPKTLKCSIMFREGVSEQVMQQYKEGIDVGVLLREVTHLKQTIARLESDITRLESEIASLEEEIERQKNQITSKQEEIRTLERKRQDLRDTVRNHERKIKTLQRTIAAIQRVKSSL
jgi:flagellar biosynthesis chaperone FliJ